MKHMNTKHNQKISLKQTETLLFTRQWKGGRFREVKIRVIMNIWAVRWDKEKWPLVWSLVDVRLHQFHF